MPKFGWQLDRSSPDAPDLLLSLYRFYFIFDLSPLRARALVAHPAKLWWDERDERPLWPGSLVRAIGMLGVPSDDLNRRLMQWLAFLDLIDIGPESIMFEGEDGERHSFLDSPGSWYWQQVLSHAEIVAKRSEAERALCRERGIAYWFYL
ncbi:MAG: hypothetical protein M3395_01555 [Chloroflexota bacterium]|nr:hypothetical protein [Chloroflexota bacterium]